ncbi:hypothetical protein IWX49DRAFT_21385 [Phyllosticta citricarpa]|uniref:Uncharacterized protein n=2 Tax=Phyllosticta TaxID=121621 RepID=A0ABR1LVB1_9PEZI
MNFAFQTFFAFQSAQGPQGTRKIGGRWCCAWRTRRGAVCGAAGGWCPACTRTTRVDFGQQKKRFRRRTREAETRVEVRFDVISLSCGSCIHVLCVVVERLAGLWWDGCNTHTASCSRSMVGTTAQAVIRPASIPTSGRRRQVRCEVAIRSILQESSLSFNLSYS